MSVVEVISSVAAVAAVSAIAWLYSQQRRQHRLLDHHREWIQEALESITHEADRKREHIHTPTITDVPETFLQLYQLIEHQPAEVRNGAREMERLWNELHKLTGDDVDDASRAAALADSIESLAGDILQELD